MTVTPTDPGQDLAVETTTAVDESTAVEATADQADFGTDEDLSIPEDIPTARRHRQRHRVCAGNEGGDDRYRRQNRRFHATSRGLHQQSGRSQRRVATR